MLVGIHHLRKLPGNSIMEGSDIREIKDHGSHPMHDDICENLVCDLLKPPNIAKFQHWQDEHRCSNQISEHVHLPDYPLTIYIMVAGVNTAVNVRMPVRPKQRLSQSSNQIRHKGCWLGAKE